MSNGSVRLPVASADTTINIISPVVLSVNGGIITIDSENIQYGAATPNQLLTCTRGVNGTAAAAHSVGALITWLEGPYLGLLPAPSQPPINYIENVLTDTTTLLAKHVDNYRVLALVGSASSYSTTLPTPSNTALTRELFVTFYTSTGKTCSINSISIATGAGQLFLYDANQTAWVAMA